MSNNAGYMMSDMHALNAAWIVCVYVCEFDLILCIVKSLFVTEKSLFVSGSIKPNLACDYPFSDSFSTERNTVWCSKSNSNG